MQVYVLHIVQMLFASISRISPGIAARIAWFLISHPGYFRFRTSVENELLELAGPLEDKADALSVVTSQGSMRVYHWMPEEPGADGPPVAILVHGWGGCGLYMTQFVMPLLNAGYQVATIDLPGHGASDGASTDAANAAELVIATARAVGRVDLLLGHSFGAIAAMLAAAGGAPLHDGVAPKQLVLLSAPASLESIVRRISRLLDLSEEAEAQLIAQVEKNLTSSISTLNSQNLLNRVSCPIFLVHDEDDTEVPFSSGAIAEVTGKNIQSLATHGLGHRRVLLAPEVIDAVAGFVKKH